MAMKNASDSATDIIADLTLSYNKQRQAKITNELLDNTTAALVVDRITSYNVCYTKLLRLTWLKHY